MKYRLVFFLIAIVGLALDLVTKSVAFHYLKDGVSGGFNEVNIIPGVFQLSCVENTGIIWGLFSNANILIFIILAGVAVPFIILMFFLIKHPGWLVTISLGLILAGALGNLYDRIVYHAVRDFLDFYLINWPKFNIADVCITTGAVLIIFTMMKPEKKSCSETPEQGDIKQVDAIEKNELG